MTAGILEFLEAEPKAAHAARAEGRARIVAVDVGYGYTKALSDAGGRACFPSVAAPDGEDALGVAGFFGGAPGHSVAVRPPEGPAGRWLVGEAARASFFASGFLGAEKPAELHDVLLLAACRLAGAGGEGPLPGQTPVLAAGLPLAFYRAQKDALRDRLSRLAAWVSADGGPERWISFARVVVLPQGAGVAFAEDDLPDGGFAGILDLGHFTADYLLIDLEAGRPVPEACGSLEVGCHLIGKAVARAFQARTGEPLPQRMESYVLRLAREGRPVQHRGRDLDLSEEFRAAAEEAARTAARQVLSAWADWAKFLGVTLLAGGGALLLKDALLRAFPNARVAADPVFANARGYLRMAARIAAG
jgi:plasmid segregation protein ParM